MQQTLLVLVVDDDAMIRSLLQSLLVSEGYSVVTAADGVEGLAALRGRRPALILLDMMMPRMDGQAFLRALAGDGYDDVPVVLLSATLGLRESARSLGVIDFLPKPFDLDDLVAKVRRHAQPAGLRINPTPYATDQERGSQPGIARW